MMLRLSICLFFAFPLMALAQSSCMLMPEKEKDFVKVYWQCADGGSRQLVEEGPVKAKLFADYAKCRHGTWKFYTKDGILKETREYYLGRRIGKYENYNEYNKLTYKFDCQKDQTSTVAIYDQDGIKRQEIKVYKDENGKLLKSKKRYTFSGKLIKEEIYRKDKLIKVIKPDPSARKS